MKKITIVWLCAIMVTALLLTACGGSGTAATLKSVVMARGIDANYQPVEPTTQFLSTDTIYVSTGFTGSPTKGVINGKFYYGTQLISEATLDISKATSGDLVAYNGDTYTAFNLTPSQPWPVDTTYHFELYIDGVKVGDYPYSVIQ